MFNRKSSTSKPDQTTTEAIVSSSDNMRLQRLSKYKLAISLSILVVTLSGLGFLGWHIYDQHHKPKHPKGNNNIHRGKIYEPIPAGQPGSKSKPARTG